MNHQTNLHYLNKLVAAGRIRQQLHHLNLTEKKLTGYFTETDTIVQQSSISLEMAIMFIIRAKHALEPLSKI